MNNTGLSFLCPIRGRNEMVSRLVDNIKKYYSNFEIIFIEQDNNMLFRKGQLFNFGYKKIKYDYVVHIDVDFRFIEYIDVISLLNTHKRGITPFNRIQQLRETGKNIGVPALSRAHGGCTFITRKLFYKSYGYSNLIFGWGCEDDIFNKRANLCRLPLIMGHESHNRQGKNMARPVNKKQPDWSINNSYFFKTDHLRNKEKDSYNQTIIIEDNIVKLDDNIIRYKIKEITVSPDFAYLDLYNKQVKCDKENIYCER